MGALCIPPLLLAGCSSLGSAMSPYSETFSCKNGDHGQCVHPEKAYEDASQGIRSRSDPAVTDDKDLLRPHRLPNSRRVVTRLEEETRIGKGGTLAAQLSRLDLIVLDELGYLPFARSGG
ncbi:MAG: TraV family lipoprotein, partial [Sphingopyxis sp.]|uniref:TraV family lipoprotein n=1 Tax=Sphingopyxis sp. TaxID=1908224 RepID=UPI003D6D9010